MALFIRLSLCVSLWLLALWCLPGVAYLRLGGPWTFPQGSLSVWGLPLAGLLVTLLPAVLLARALASDGEGDGETFLSLWIGALGLWSPVVLLASLLLIPAATPLVNASGEATEPYLEGRPRTEDGTFGVGKGPMAPLRAGALLFHDHYLPAITGQRAALEAEAAAAAPSSGGSDTPAEGGGEPDAAEAEVLPPLDLRPATLEAEDRPAGLGAADPLEVLVSTDAEARAAAAESNVVKVTVRGEVGDAGLAALAELPHLISLRVEALGGLGPKGVEALGRCRKLRDLELARTGAAGAELDLSALTDLRSLRVEGPGPVGDATLKSLGSKHAQLNEVWIEDAQAVTDAGVEGLRGTSGLRRLRLAGAQLTDTGLCTLGRNVAAWLEVLELPGIEASGAGLRCFPRTSTLRRLVLPTGHAGQAALREVRRLNDLRELGLVGGLRVRWQHLKPLSSLSHLTRLELPAKMAGEDYAEARAEVLAALGEVEVVYQGADGG